MKNIIGTIVGFAVGVTLFLWLFKIIIIDRTSPEDELAPGIVVMAAALNGGLFAFIGYSIQNYLGKKKNYK